jgi:NAD(P)-dependent dehydrogenase (short-subunit alcohol dehydrogenase family)
LELNLKGKTAFITGASRGIGAQIAESYAAEGIHLALFARDVSACGMVAEKIRAKYAGLRIAVIPLDFLKPPTNIKTAVEAGVKQLGGVDILVNCAGGAYRAELVDVPDEEWEKQFAVKPFGLVRMTRETLPYLKKSSQPRIINISGTRGMEPSWFSVVSGPINAGTNSITKALAIQLGGFGITVNAICPGSTDTRRWKETVELTSEKLGVSKEKAIEHLVKEVPMGRVVVPQDIADTAVFLASSRAGMITGSSINVDGGRTRGV